MVEKIIYQKKNKGHSTSKIIKFMKSFDNGYLPNHLFISTSNT